MLLNKGDKILKEGQDYIAICADEEYVVLAPTKNYYSSVDFTKLECYSNLDCFADLLKIERRCPCVK